MTCRNTYNKKQFTKKQQTKNRKKIEKYKKTKIVSRAE